jgi:hypothetical protein
MSLASKLVTFYKLGLVNIWRVAIYRLRLKHNLHPVQNISSNIPEGPFFSKCTMAAAEPAPKPNLNWKNQVWRFGWHKQQNGGAPPDWFANPFSEQSVRDTAANWWEISDFGQGDIKGIWELSRFNWVIALATMAKAGEQASIEQMNSWVRDWCEKNPPYKGPNWKCGQEASLRVLHLILSAWILGQDTKPTLALVKLIEAHLKRIAPTISYAVGQQNNHGTSEAAALFIGGSFLVGHSQEAESWARLGRYWLNERATSLILPDGTFSQYSVVYHRLMLDTYSFCEAWRRKRNLPFFNKQLYQRLAAATRWLANITDVETGDAPNIGANDGAHILTTTNCDYRDFRPSIQLASTLYCEGRYYDDGPWDDALKWLEIEPRSKKIHQQSSSMKHGGFHVLRRSDALAVLRFPNFDFRPSQCDALHLDFWCKGINVMRDAGTFSYNSELYEWFSSSAAHNTIEFDGSDQMPRIGRFLYDSWLSSIDVISVQDKPHSLIAGAAYRDKKLNTHKRTVELQDNKLICNDEIDGNFNAAILRWRLAPLDWKLEGNSVLANQFKLEIISENAHSRIILTDSWESKFYQHKSKIPEVQLHIMAPTTIKTVVTY